MLILFQNQFPGWTARINNTGNNRKGCHHSVCGL